MSWLDRFFLGRATVYAAGVFVATEAAINFVSGASAVDNPGAGRVDITCTGSTAVTGTGLWYSTAGVVNGTAVLFIGDVQLGTLSGSSVPTTVVSLTGAANVVNMLAASLTYASSQALCVIGQATLAGTGANAGSEFLVQAQAGQQQSGVNANNNGGPLRLASGPAGTGGSGAAGLPGALQFYVGATQAGSMALAASDFLAVGTNPPASGFVRATQSASGTTKVLSVKDTGSTDRCIVGYWHANTADDRVQMGWGADTLGAASLVFLNGVNYYQTTTHIFANSSGAGIWQIPMAFGGAAAITCSDTTATSVTISQSDTAVASATGTTFTIHAQNATGTTANGGALALKSGTGTTAAGAVQIWAGGTQLASLGLASTDYIALGPIPAVGTLSNSVLRLSNGAIFACRNQANNADRRYLAYINDAISIGDAGVISTNIQSAAFIIACAGNTEANIAGNSTSDFITLGNFAAAATVTLNYNSLTFARLSGACTITQSTAVSDVAVTSMTIQAMSAFATATVNPSGADLILEGGTASGSGAAGTTHNGSVYVKASPLKGDISAISTTGGTTTLTPAQAGALILEFTGTLTSNATINVPNVAGVSYKIFNNTTGAFTLTVQANGGSGFAVAQGKRAEGYINGSTAFVRSGPDT